MEAKEDVITHARPTVILITVSPPGWPSFNSFPSPLHHAFKLSSPLNLFLSKGSSTVNWSIYGFLERYSQTSSWIVVLIKRVEWYETMVHLSILPLPSSSFRPFYEFLEILNNKTTRSLLVSRSFSNSIRKKN